MPRIMRKGYFLLLNNIQDLFQKMHKELENIAKWFCRKKLVLNQGNENHIFYRNHEKGITYQCVCHF